MLSGYNFANNINASREEASLKQAWCMGSKPDLSGIRTASGYASNKIGKILMFKPLQCPACL